MASDSVESPNAVPSFADSVTAHWSRAYQPRVEFYRSILNNQHSSRKAPSEALRQMREESIIIKAQHALLHECHNALLPVSRLAPELLSHVFHFLAQDLPLVPDEAEKLDRAIYMRRRERNANSHPLRRSWTKVLFVSRHFRRTALGDPSLWPTITTALGQEWMAKLIDFSGSSLVTFHLGARYDGMKKATKAALLKTISRVRGLQITSDSKGLRALRLSSIELPELHQIRFHMEADEEDANTDSEDTVPTWDPTALAQVNAPALRKLSIHGFGDFPWASNLLQHHLTTLHIGIDLEPSYDHVEFPSLRAMLSALSRLSSLTTLSLKRCKVKVIESALAVACLPLLRTLRLEDCSYMLVAYTFAHLQVPQEAKLYFSTDINRFNDRTSPHMAHNLQMSQSFFRTLQEHLATPFWQDLRTVELMTMPEAYPEMYSTDDSVEKDDYSDYDDIDKQCFVMNAWRQDDSRIVCADCERVPRRKKGYFDTPFDYVRYERPEPDLTISIYHGRESFKFADECLRLFEHSPSVRTLSLRPDHKTWTLGGWPKSLDSFTNVSFLRVDGVLGQVILQRLYERGIASQGTGGSGAKPPQVLPRLKSLALLRDGEHVRWRTRPDIPGFGDRLQLLAAVWKLRAESGASLQEVALDERRCALSHFQSLRKTVNIRAIHLWDFGSYEPILSEEEDEESEEEDEDDYDGHTYF
ncbi:unnamed protein product [Peniophora sp. CBMAI 1063]|nr:unnamed protein product [Peniophora sp. CBMAI 1063]